MAILPSFGETEEERKRRLGIVSSDLSGYDSMYDISLPTIDTVKKSVDTTDALGGLVDAISNLESEQSTADSLNDPRQFRQEAFIKSLQEPETTPAIETELPKLETPSIDRQNIRNQPKTMFPLNEPHGEPQKEGLAKLFTPENYAGIILPLLGIVESIGSKGMSPGTTALTQQQQIYGNIDRKRKWEADDAAKQKQARLDALQDNYRTELRNAKTPEEMYSIAMKYGEPKDIIDMAEKIATMKDTKKDYKPYQNVADIMAQRLYGSVDPRTGGLVAPTESPMEIYRMAKMQLGNTTAVPSGYQEPKTDEEARSFMTSFMSPATLDALQKRNIDIYKANHPAIMMGQQATFGNIDVMGTRKNPALELIVDRILRGKEDPTQAVTNLNKRGAGVAPVQYVENRLAEEGFSSVDAKAKITYWTNYKTQNVIQQTNNLMGQLPQLRAAVQKMRRLGVPAIDQHGIELMKQAGDVDAANLIANYVATQEDIAKVTAGGNALTDEQLALAGRIFNQGANLAQAESQINALVGINNARKAAVYSQAGIYGKYAAQDDPYLPEDIKLKILNGQLVHSPISQDDVGSQAAEQYIVGKIYPDAQGNRAKYLGNGQWQEVK